MISIKDYFIKKLKIIIYHPNRNLWLIVLSALFLNIVFNLHLVFTYFQGALNVSGKHYLEWLFFPLDNVRYGHYLAKKLYLPIIAFILLFIWVIKRVRILQLLRENLFQVIFILSALFVSRFYTFQHWFFLDDYRFLGFKYVYVPTGDIQYVPCCGDLYTVQALMMLVMKLFGNNFYPYNLLGLIIYFFIGIFIYLICLKLQKSKQVALLLSLFFITVPTYFYATLAMVDFIGDSFTLLLFVISLYFLITKYYAHALIFTLASLEFGLSRSHIIPVPFILTAFFFATPKERKKVLAMSLLLIISILPYFPLIIGRSGGNELKLVNYLFNPEYLTYLFNMLTHVIFPFRVLGPIISLLNSLYASNYLAPFLGLITLISLIYFAVLTHIKKCYKTSKLIIIGISLILLSVVFPPIAGVRNDARIVDYTKDTILAYMPSVTTGYGLFPALGIVLILIGISLIIKNLSIFKKALIVLTIIDSLSFISADYNWYKLISYKQINISEGLNSVLSRDGKVKLILLTKKGQTVWNDILRFRDIYGPVEKMILFENQEAWEKYNKLNHPSIKQIYLFSYNDNDSEQKLINLSEAYRNGKYQDWWKIE